MKTLLRVQDALISTCKLSSRMCFRFTFFFFFHSWGRRPGDEDSALFKGDINYMSLKLGTHEPKLTQRRAEYGRSG